MNPQKNNTTLNQSNEQRSQFDIWGIYSLIFLFVFHPLGLVLGIYGYTQAKKMGYNGTLSFIGAILNGIVLTITSIIVITFIITTINK